MARTMGGLSIVSIQARAWQVVRFGVGAPVPGTVGGWFVM
jgi:hypothetical protein